MRTLVCFLTLCSLNSLAWTATKQDFELLWEQEEYRQWIHSLWKTAPSQRPNNWQSKLAQAAEKMTLNLTQNRLFSEENKNYLLQLRAKALLQDKEFFLQAVDHYLIEYLKFQGHLKVSEQEQKKVFTHIWRKEAKNIKLADKMLSYFEEFPSSQLASQYSAELLSYIGSHELSEFYCKKPIFFKLWKQTSRKALLKLRLQPLKRHLLQKFNPECLKAMASISLTSEINVDQLKLQALFYPQAKNYDSSLVQYLLQYPFPGDLFNLAANKLEELSQKPQKREQILHYLETLSQFPEGFITRDTPQQKEMLKTLKNLYPELLTAYAAKCLSYLKAPSPRAPNPTPHCLESIKNRKLENVLSPFTIKQLKAAAFLP